MTPKTSGARSTELRFPLRVALVLVIGAAVLAWPLALRAAPATQAAVALGALLATVNVLLGYAAIEYAFGRSYTAFLKAVLGGMGVRMVLVLGAMAALIVSWSVPVLPLALSLFGFYVVFLALEVLYIQQKVSDRHQEQHASGR